MRTGQQWRAAKERRRATRERRMEDSVLCWSVAKDYQRGYAAIALHNPKSLINIGSALRAAQVFGAAMLVAGGGRRYERSRTDTMHAYRHVPFMCVDSVLDVIPYDCVPVAVERMDGATPLPLYAHPQRAFYVFGPEDGDLPDAILSRCRDVVAIPCGCLNLAAAVNVVLYDRIAKAAVRAAEATP
jgi:tRNA(Leu) C34 or U34 (ribose-2'-O)-methylase TrmL